jgi:hypothetical protein
MTVIVTKTAGGGRTVKPDPNAKMPSPNEASPGPQQSRGVSGAVVAIVIVSSMTMAVGCLGVCGGIAFLARTKIQSAMAEAGVPLPAVISTPPDTDWNDWMVRRELTHLYQTSLDSVSANQALIANLGGSVEMVLETDSADSWLVIKHPTDSPRPARRSG